jgi:diadenosine tetraphosphate (Ap4A) HIT family hydrolase
MKNCLICERIELIRRNENPYFVVELETGYVVLGDHQFFRGYTLFLCRECKGELHELDPGFRRKFLEEMAMVAEAVFRAFKPVKLNYELLGNTERHMHWHIFPRHADDPLPERTVWSVDKEVREAEGVEPDAAFLEELKAKLRDQLMF